MKKAIHISLLTAVTGILLLLVLSAGLLYRTRYEKTEITCFVSPDQTYRLTVLQIGEPQMPYGPGNCRLVLTRSGKDVCALDFTMHNDGKLPEDGNFAVLWSDDRVSVTVSAEEQENVTYILFYDGHTGMTGSAAGRSEADCPHERYDRGVCTVCGKQCGHEGQCAPACSICGMELTHEWENGRCSVCGLECVHEWTADGFCTICGLPCEHASHTGHGSAYEAAVCTVCGAPVLHEWVNGVCAVCGETFTFLDGAADYAMFDPVLTAEDGTVVTFGYPTHYYRENAPAEETEKQMTVYLPYGYDENGQYDLLLLFVGIKGNSTLYLDQNAEYYDLEEIRGVRDLFDNMISLHLCRPFIAATIEYRSSGDTYEARYGTDRYQMASELRFDILPYLCEHYALYPENGSVAELHANRQHIAAYGASYGAYIVFSSVLSCDYDLAGWYGATDGGWYSGASIAADLAGKQDDPLFFLYVSGDEPAVDSSSGEAYRIYLIFDARSELLTDGYNGHANTILNSKDDATSWATSLFNFVRLCWHAAE